MLKVNAEIGLHHNDTILLNSASAESPDTITRKQTEQEDLIDEHYLIQKVIQLDEELVSKKNPVKNESEQPGTEFIQFAAEPSQDRQPHDADVSAYINKRMRDFVNI